MEGKSKGLLEEVVLTEQTAHETLVFLFKLSYKSGIKITKKVKVLVFEKDNMFIMNVTLHNDSYSMISDFLYLFYFRFSYLYLVCLI